PKSPLVPDLDSVDYHVVDAVGGAAEAVGLLQLDRDRLALLEIQEPPNSGGGLPNPGVGVLRRPHRQAHVVGVAGVHGPAPGADQPELQRGDVVGAQAVDVVPPVDLDRKVIQPGRRHRGWADLCRFGGDIRQVAEDEKVRRRQLRLDGVRAPDLRHCGVNRAVGGYVTYRGVCGGGRTDDLDRAPTRTAAGFDDDGASAAARHAYLLLQACGIGVRRLRLRCR